MSKQRVLPVEVEFAGIRSNLIQTSYAHADALALLLVDAYDGSPVITASVNIAGVSETLPDSQFALKEYSEGEGLLAALEGPRIVEDTGQSVATGFVQCPIVRLLY